MATYERTMGTGAENPFLMQSTGGKANGTRRDDPARPSRRWRLIGGYAASAWDCSVWRRLNHCSIIIRTHTMVP